MDYSTAYVIRMYYLRVKRITYGCVLIENNSQQLIRAAGP